MDQELAVLFCLAGEEYAISAAHVKEILCCQELNSQSKTCYSGKVMSGSRNIPVISLSSKFDIQTEEKGSGWVIIVEMASQEFGLLVDEVTEVQYLSVALLKMAAEFSYSKASWLRGIGKTGRRLISMLDLPQIFPESELEALSAAPESGREFESSYIAYAP